MKATKLELAHFRSSRHLTIDLEPGLNLLVGVNGAGKTTILDALAILLSWAAARLRSFNSRGRGISDTDIHNEKSFARLTLTCRADLLEKDEISWKIFQWRKGVNSNPNDQLMSSDLMELNEWSDKARIRIGRSKKKINVPLFVYYPVNRAVLDIPLRIRKADAFDLPGTYDGASTRGTNFRDFFEWYRNREDLENEHFRESGGLVEDPQLRAVRQAILSFLPEFSKISVKRNPLRMEVEKNGRKLRVDQLSDGEKCLFAMVGDLARRLAIANPVGDEPLKGEGIVLIDEIDLHLHPSWQRMVVAKLTETFPNCQFILSTHSPQVYGEVPAQCIRRLSVDERIHGLMSTIPTQALGLDSAEILEEQMDTNRRNEGVSEQLANIFRLIDFEKFAEARSEIQKVRELVGGSIPELVRAESLITMLEPDDGKPA